MKLTLIEDWRRAHKFASVQIAAAAVFVLGLGPELLSAWGSLPDDLKQALPQGTSRWVSMTAFALVIVGRVVKRAPKDGSNGTN